MFRKQLRAKVLALRRRMGWNARSIHFQEQSQMHVKRRRILPNFETCSVALFASMALYGPLPLRAQTSAPPAPSVASTPSTHSAPSRNGAPGAQAVSTQDAIPPNRWTREQLSQVFKKSDVNSDGLLSREEASVWAGLSRRFDQIDANKDGSISSAEFDEALK